MFVVAALSFDVGRRASTQTELQSFTDHVALTAAGELNGFPGAIERATRAANQLVLNESFVIGEGVDGDVFLEPGDFNLYFYETLPPLDATPLSNNDSALLNNADRDQLARFVRVAFNADASKGDKRVTVEWVFARLLSLFGTTDLPSELVGAESVAGYTSYACDVAPVFFCMPEEFSAATNGEEIWEPGDFIGQTIRLRAGGGQGGKPKGGFWEPGNFTWLDVREQVSQQDLINSDSPCKNLSGNNLYECLFAAEDAVTYCQGTGLLTTLPGQKEGNVAAVFDTRFDMYGASSSQVADDPHYKPAPVVTKAYTDGGTCGGSDSTTNTTMAFPPDDCFGSTNCAIPGGEWNGLGRYGDMTWERGRIEYVDQNYSMSGTPGQVDLDDLVTLNEAGDGFEGEIIEIDDEKYHVYDPFRPEADSNDIAELPGYDDLTVAERAVLETSLQKANVFPDTDFPAADFPVVPGGKDIDVKNGGAGTRWQYYQAEVAASLYNSPKLIYNPDTSLDTNDLDRIDVYSPNEFLERDPPLELIRSFADGTYNRAGSSRPSCADGTDPETSLNYSRNPKRRTLVAAVVDCAAQKITGKQTDVFAPHFVEVFLLSPSGNDPNDNKKKEIFVEIISPSLSAGGDNNVAPGRFRNFVQLYQ